MNEIRILPAVRTGQAGVSKFREIQEATSFGAASLYDLGTPRSANVVILRGETKREHDVVLY